MIWSPSEIVNMIARYHDLYEGDIIFTGTPEGVGKVEKNERVEVSLNLPEAEAGQIIECNFVLA